MPGKQSFDAHHNSAAGQDRNSHHDQRDDGDNAAKQGSESSDYPNDDSDRTDHHQLMTRATVVKRVRGQEFSNVFHIGF